jgi:hypothetical protein
MSQKKIQANQTEGLIQGPASSTDNALARYDGTTGKLIQDSTEASLADNGVLRLGPTEVEDVYPSARLKFADNTGNLSDIAVTSYGGGFGALVMTGVGGTADAPADSATNMTKMGVIRFQRRAAGVYETVGTIHANGNGNLVLSPGPAGTATSVFLAAGVNYSNGVPIVTTTETQTLSNKTITPRINQVTSTSSYVPTVNNHDGVRISALAAALSIANPTGTPMAMHRYTIRIKDNGTARALTWGTSYRGIGFTLPSSTVASKLLYIGMLYNEVDAKWDVISVAQE